MLVGLEDSVPCEDCPDIQVTAFSLCPLEEARVEAEINYCDASSFMTLILSDKGPTMMI